MRGLAPSSKSTLLLSEYSPQSAESAYSYRRLRQILAHLSWFPTLAVELSLL
jgi:hypothetical protein